MDRRQFLASALLIPAFVVQAPESPAGARLVPVGAGWARNQINAVIFRRHALTSHGDLQFISYYDVDGRVVLGVRRHGDTRWRLQRTPLAGGLHDAHNAISIAVDGRGTLHVAWNHHTSALQYCRGIEPGSLELTDPVPMTGNRESRVTYPEFFSLAGGDLLFLYRDGVSGDGRLIINRYDVSARKWERVQDNLVSGEGRRSAYWQAIVGADGALHLSWVWRESPDVRTNHDLAYAVSRDGGKTWTTSAGEAYGVPITASTAEYAARIAEGRDLINQTSMCADHRGRPVIATYWRPQSESPPQYHIVHHDGRSWRTVQVTRRTTGFSLGGRGTQRIPISRPLILADARNGRTGLVMIFRDEERGNRVTMAYSEDPMRQAWIFRDLTDFPVDFWEPCGDLAHWGRTGDLHLFVQRVGQGAHESLEDMPPQPISVLELDVKEV